MDNNRITFFSDDDPYKDISQAKVTNFDLFVPWACNEFSMENDVIVTRSTQKPYQGAVPAKKKGTSKKQMSTIVGKSTTENIGSDNFMKSQLYERLGGDDEEETATFIKTVYDTHDRLVQIKLLQNEVIPRKVMQVIGLAVPFHQLLISLVINMGLRIETLYEIAKFLPNSHITEICLDNTYLTKAHYHILLTHGKLKHLSLARCSINDAVVKMITDQLGLASPASKVLCALNLSSNKITDVGATCIADMLRTNRHLSYLNLAGNMITDVGGMRILNTLKKFPLESEELFKSKNRYLAYLQKKHEFIRKVVTELLISKESSTKRRTVAKTKSDTRSLHRTSTRVKSIFESGLIQEKAEQVVVANMEPYEDPFSSRFTETRDGVVYCLGNHALCYLNISYNNLSYACVKTLLEVVQMQKKCLSRPPGGLIRVLFEGNFMPSNCSEYEQINRTLQSLGGRSQFISPLNKKATKSKIKL